MRITRIRFAGRPDRTTLRTALISIGVVIFACSAPYVREALVNTPSSDGMDMPMASVPASTAHLLIAAKVGLAIAMLAGILKFVMSRQSNAWAGMAAAPLLRSMLVVAAVVGGTLAGLDLCSSYGGAGMDDSGACHCWITGALSAIASLVSAATILAGRAIAALLKRAVRAVIRAVWHVLRIRRSAQPLRRLEREAIGRTDDAPATRIGFGRAPPRGMPAR